MTDLHSARAYLAADGVTFTEVGHTGGGIAVEWPDPPEGSAFDVEALRRGLRGGTVVTSAVQRELTGRIAFRQPAEGHAPEALVGCRVESLTLHGANLAGPGFVVTEAKLLDDGDLWIIAERWEVKA